MTTDAAISLTETGATALHKYRDNLVASLEPEVQDWSAAEMSDLAKQLTRLAKGRPPRTRRPQREHHYATEQQR
jgi:hypothetical protein